MLRSSAAGDDTRHALARRLDRAVAALPDPASPLVVVDLDAFDANAADLLRRADGTPIRIASKSLRIPALIERVLARPGFHGVLAYTLREALWLVRAGVTADVLMGYPSVDRVALRDLLGDAEARERVTLMVDHPDHLRLLEGAGDRARKGARVAIDVDAGLRLGSGPWAQYVGPKRSPLHATDDVLAFAREIVRRGHRLVGVMTYEGQVAGLQDDVPGRRARSATVRRLKDASVDQLLARRDAIARGLAEIGPLELWNAGGSGSVETTVADPRVTEVAAGSGLLVPGLFDHYRSFEPRPAAYFGVPVVRRPNPSTVTVAGGGFIASGPPGADRSPLPWAPPGLALTGLEGAGEVQTPLVGPGTKRLRIGDRVWFRHAKSGELAEHTNVVHLVAGDEVVGTVPSYRGLGLAW